MNRTNEGIYFKQRPRSRGVLTEMVCGLYSILFKTLFLFFKDRKVVLLGRGSELSDTQLREIRNFRNHYYVRNSPYLLDGKLETSAEDHFIDRVSYHVMASKNDIIYGVMRITPYPFECYRNRDFPIERLEGKEEYLEFNRLVTRKSDRLLNKMFMTGAAVFSFSELKRDGLVAISRSNKKHLFLRMGLSVQGEPFRLKDRENEEYTFLSSNFIQLARNNLANLFTGRII